MNAMGFPSRYVNAMIMGFELPASVKYIKRTYIVFNIPNNYEFTRSHYLGAGCIAFSSSYAGELTCVDTI
jgi:hypothetical protein